MTQIKLKGNDVKLTGDLLKVGDFAPEVKVVLPDLSEKIVGGKKDKVQLLITVPSLDTGVCATEARRFKRRKFEIRKCGHYNCINGSSICSEKILYY